MENDDGDEREGPRERQAIREGEVREAPAATAMDTATANT